jgi:hypothetical protein
MTGSGCGIPPREGRIKMVAPYRRWLSVGAVFGIALAIGCSGLPPIEEQVQHVKNNDLVIRKLTPRAFVKAWGKPPYQRFEFMHFFGLKDGSMVPQSRLAIGEAPKGWEADFEVGEGLSLLYPDQGWLVVFFDERLVYREALSADKLHAIGLGWKKEDQFKPKMEMPSPPR